MNKLFEKWAKVKERHSDRIVLVRASVFYITFDKDAEKLHIILGLELNKAKKANEGYKYTAHFLHFKLDEMLSKAIANGERFCVADK